MKWPSWACRGGECGLERRSTSSPQKSVPALECAYRGSLSPGGRPLGLGLEQDSQILTTAAPSLQVLSRTAATQPRAHQAIQSPQATVSASLPASSMKVLSQEGRGQEAAGPLSTADPESRTARPLPRAFAALPTSSEPVWPLAAPSLGLGSASRGCRRPSVPSPPQGFCLQKRRLTGATLGGTW